MLQTYISGIIIILGAIFIAISALGIVRFPDLNSRLHAITKATSFGLTLIVTGVTIYFNEPVFYLKGVLIIIFIYLTAPLAAWSIIQSKKKS